MVFRTIMMTMMMMIFRARMDANGIFEIKPKYKKVGDEQNGLDLLEKVIGLTQKEIEQRHQQQNMECLPRTPVNLTITSILSYFCCSLLMGRLGMSLPSHERITFIN